MDELMCSEEIVHSEIVENVSKVPLDDCICLYYEKHHFKAFLPPHK